MTRLPNYGKIEEYKRDWLWPTSPTKENLSAWFNAGVTCVGMGSQLISKEILANKDFDKLALNVANALKIIEQVRNL